MLAAAGQPDIIRALQKDDYHVSVFQEQCRDLVSNLFGRRGDRWCDEVSVLASVAYFSFTTLTGRSTLGEEYCDIRQVTGNQYLPSLPRRSAFVLLRNVFPYVYQRALRRYGRDDDGDEEGGGLNEEMSGSGSGGWRSEGRGWRLGREAEAEARDQESAEEKAKAKDSTSSSSLWSSLLSYPHHFYHRLRAIFLSICRTIKRGIERVVEMWQRFRRFVSRSFRSVLRATSAYESLIQKAHLALFYLFGRYLEIAKRVSGIHYIYLRGDARRPSYHMLGLLLLAQMLLWLLSQAFAVLTKAVWGSTRWLITSVWSRWSRRHQSEITPSPNPLGLSHSQQSELESSSLAPLSPSSSLHHPHDSTHHHHHHGDEQPHRLDELKQAVGAADEEEDKEEGEGAEVEAQCTLCLCPRTQTSVTECGHLFCWECLVDCLTSKVGCWWGVACLFVCLFVFWFSRFS